MLIPWIYTFFTASSMFRFAASAFRTPGRLIPRPFSAAAKAIYAADASASSFTPAALHPSFSLLNDSFVQEYGVRALTYEHVKSGAQVISMMAPDDNKVFGITFRTPPGDSTGLPHILEHSVLCGSRKYPTKEPFVHLLKGSLNTFLNAFTYPDRTCYPVASQNSKDFYNLINVYLDAVLYPRAVNDPKVLAQEGWHYALENASDPLLYKGVVYNEMKGVYSSPDAIRSRATQHALFPDNAYVHDSGGDPAVIPDITFDSFKRFHAEYYHPSNSRVFFYGNDDPLKRLELLDEYLRDFSLPKTPVAPRSRVAMQRKTSSPRTLELKYPTGSKEETKQIFSINWLLNEQPFTPAEELALSVLNHLLLGTTSSMLRKALTDSNLGESVFADFSDELIQATFEVGMKGVAPENVGKLEALIHSVLARAAVDGFEDSDVQASMNSIEFHLREFNTGGYPKGLSLMLGMMSKWIYDRNPVDALRFEQPLRELKASLAAKEPVFQNLIKKYLISNEHKITVVMKPDHEFNARVNQVEEEKLKGIKGSMSPTQLQEVIRSTEDLLASQTAEDTPEARATLPRLELADIDRKQPEIPVSIEDLSFSDAKRPRGQTSRMLVNVLPTSGILYANVGINIDDIPMDELELLPLFARMLTETGTKDLDVVSLQRKINSETGGVYASYHTDIKQKSGVISHPNDALMYFTLSGKAMTAKAPELFRLFLDVLCNARLDNQKRAVEMLRESKSRREAAVISNGNSYAATRIAARNSALGFYREVTSGITYARSLDRLLNEAENNWPAFQARLERIRNSIIKNEAESLVINLTGDESVIAATRPVVHDFMSELSRHSLMAESALSSNKAPARPFLASFDESHLLPRENEGFVVPSQVNYVVKGGPLFKPLEPVKGSFAVAARYLNTGYLWDTVRVMGGAYGGSGSFNAVTGRYLFSSYRDPNIVNTLNAYDEAWTALAPAGDGSYTISDEEITEAVIGSIGDIDSPQSPDQKGFTSLARFLNGASPKDRQQWRDEILATSAADFKAFGERLSALSATDSTSVGVVVFGSEGALKEANAQLPETKRLALKEPFPSDPKAT